MPCPRAFVTLAAITCLQLAAIAQEPASLDRVALPPGTGTLARPAGWTALADADLTAPSRPTDPKDGPAKQFLLAVLQKLQDRKDGSAHVILHSAAPNGSLRLVNAYSTLGGLASKDLQAEGELELARKAFTTALTSPGVTVTLLDSDTTPIFPVGSLALHFERTAPNQHTFVDYYLVPAGERLQTFEVMRFADDLDARGEIESLLRTFDGAKEGGQDPILRSMLIGGAAGGIAGLITALLRRRRAQQAAARSQAEPR